MHKVYLTKLLNDTIVIGPSNFPTDSILDGQWWILLDNISREVKLYLKQVTREYLHFTLELDNKVPRLSIDSKDKE